VTTVGTVDYHTAGEPFRIVAEPGPIPGATMLEKRAWCAGHLDHLRRLLVYEPRGHADMYGCFVTEPCAPGSDLGCVFFHNAGYSTACGHGTIALATWAGRDRLQLDVPSGTLAVARRDGGYAFRNVPAFVLLRDVEAAGLRCDVAFGGAFYASVESPLPLDRAHLPQLIELGRRIKAELEAAHDVVHPREPGLRDVYGVIFFTREGDRVQRNVTIFADGEVDRSPCGSGTSARLALLDADGELPRGETLTHRSIVDTVFTGRVVAETPEGVVTEIAGRASLTGRHEFVLEPDDEVGEGFLLR
jgi:proline racemase